MKRISTGALCSLFIYLLASSCADKEITNDLKCSSSDLVINLVSKTSATSCKSIDAQVEVAGVGGTGPYDYKKGDGIYQTNPVFTDLGAGTYTFFVKDTKGCIRQIDIQITANNSTLEAGFSSTPDNQCEPPHVGAINVTPTGGALPYVVKIDDGVFGSSTSFSGLTSGVHTVVVKDGADCELILNVTVVRESTGVSYLGEIQPILTAACNFASCHGAGTGSRDWTDITKVQAKAANIKTRTGLRTMPIGGGPTLTDQQILLIACWVDDGAKNN